jgi:hypothetical protein
MKYKRGVPRRAVEHEPLRSDDEVDDAVSVLSTRSLVRCITIAVAPI